MLRHIWIFSGSRFYAFILFLLFSLLILKYGVGSSRSSFATLFLIDLGISVTDAGIGFVICVYCLVLYLVTRRAGRALLFALPPMSYLVYLTSMEYIRNINWTLGVMARTWTTILRGDVSIQTVISVHPGTIPFYEKLGAIVFPGALYVVLAIIALYSFRGLLRLRARHATHFGLPAFQGTFLFFYIISMLVYLGNRMLPTYSMTDYGEIAIAIAQVTVPIMILPMSTSIQRMLGDRGNKWRLLGIRVPARRLLAVSLLVLVIFSGLGNVYNVLYPKSARDEVASLRCMQSTTGFTTRRTRDLSF
jgi:hypothetical protein